jgi:phosphinothricin acetyltransferase
MTPRPDNNAMTDSPNNWPVRAVDAGDAAAIARIYNHYIQTTVITFEEQTLSDAAMAQRIADVSALGLPWLVAEEDGQLLGYAYATRWKPRTAYRYSVEITVYMAPGSAGKGLGTALYAELFRQLRALGVHAAVGGIALPNEASIALHEKVGMKKIGEFEQIGFKQGRWLNVGYWQIVFDDNAAQTAAAEQR